ncbi:MAG: DNA-binding protein [Candidatus Scalindua sp.]|jgi:hypothetical protein|nr:DNA-binding protein [Candidatus Scalindua sp.]MBT6053415.1 DNA-binding protein [Candidatus Scalindua sp.]MBT6226121.1 DNA-binding protein [Candidatus Scalindua sp.]
MDQGLMSKIYLNEYINGDHAFGNKEGKKVFQKLQDYISSCPNQKIFGVSLKKVKATDASFPRESVVSLAKLYKGEKGFYLCDFSSPDIVDNWHYAAQAKQQSLIVMSGGGYDLIGPEITSSTKKLLDFIMSEGTVTTAMVSTKFDVSIQNASAKLKKLFEQGLLLGSKETAESGGLEFVYTAIK